MSAPIFDTGLPRSLQKWGLADEQGVMHVMGRPDMAEIIYMYIIYLLPV